MDNSHSDKSEVVYKVSLNLHVPDEMEVEHLKNTIHLCFFGKMSVHLLLPLVDW